MKIFFNLSLLLLSTGGLCAEVLETPSDKTILQLQPQAVVQDSEVWVGSVLSSNCVFASGVDQTTVRAVRLGTSPALGRSQTVRFSDVENALATVLPKGTYTWGNDKESVVTRPCTEVSEAKVLELLKEAVSKYAGTDGETKVLRLLNFAPIQVPQSEITFALDLVSPNTKTSFGNAELNVFWKDRTFQKRNIRFEWEWKRLVWVAPETIPVGLVSPGQFRRELKNVVGLQSDPIWEETFTDGMAVIRPLGKGDIFLRSHVGSVIAISRGNIVKARINAGAMEVSTKVVAMENGAIGQFIRCENPTSRREVYGKVINANVIDVAP